MQCPDCGYVMSDFDKVCPRCVWLAKQQKTPPRVATAPESPAHRRVTEELAREQPYRPSMEVPLSRRPGSPTFSGWAIIGLLLPIIGLIAGLIFLAMGTEQGKATGVQILIFTGIGVALGILAWSILYYALLLPMYS
jgi:hypothetical protein